MHPLSRQDKKGQPPEPTTVTGSGRPSPARVRPVTASVPVEEQGLDESTMLDKPWQTVVWNDPVNLMSYVTFVFQQYFGYSRTRAEELMLQVHHDGKSVVSSGSREEMERDVRAMHDYGLWATLERVDD